MGTYDNIHATITEYRNSFAKVLDMLQQVSAEKESRADLVAWYRRRNFIIRTQITPVYNLAQANINALKQQMASNEDSTSGMTNDQYQAEVQILRAKRDKARKELDAEYKPALTEAENEINAYQEKLNHIKVLEDAYDDEDSARFTQLWKQYCIDFDRYIGAGSDVEGYMKVSNLNMLMDDKAEAVQLETRWSEKLDEYQKLYAKSRDEITAVYASEYASLTEKYKSDEAENNASTSNDTIEFQIQKWSDIIASLQVIADIVDGLANTEDLKAQSNSINARIAQANSGLDALDADISRVEPVPADTSADTVGQLFDEIRATISEIRGLYPQKKFDDALHVLDRVSHDMNDNRGVKAFSNRASELQDAVNTGITWENTHKWQITGVRYERKAGNQYGPTKVTPTHPTIPLI